jgi:hypothetical protein
VDVANPGPELRNAANPGGLPGHPLETLYTATIGRTLLLCASQQFRIPIAPWPGPPGTSQLSVEGPRDVNTPGNHAFIDGNKRVGANAAVTFLSIDDWDQPFDEAELVDLLLSVASSRLSKPRLIEIFESRCKPQDKL